MAFKPPINQLRPPKSVKQSVTTLPWDGVSEDREAEALFDRFYIDPKRWNKAYPYQLLVADASKNYAIISSSQVLNNKFGLNTKSTAVKGESGITYILEQNVLGGGWVYNFPITPQSLQITDQYAINVSSTMRGVVEEHAGIRFKIITITGTTGIWPSKPTLGGVLKTPNSLETIFAGTLEVADRVKTQFQGIANAFRGQHPNETEKVIFPGEEGTSEFSTGYYQMLYLSQFLERYAQLKRKPENKNWRLIFNIPKQNQAFVVTPMQFIFKQDQNNPNQMFFTIQFKAWKRISLSNVKGVVPVASLKVDVNDYQRMLNTISQVRRTLGSVTDLIKSVRSDFQQVFNNLRQVALVIKDVAGIGLSVIDLPRQIIADAKETIQDSIKDIANAFRRPTSVAASSATQGNTAITGGLALKSSGPVGASTKIGQAVDAIVAQSKILEGLSASQVKSGALGKDLADSLETSIVNNVFENPEEYFDLFDAISIDDINLNEKQTEQIQQDINNATLINVEELRRRKQELLNLALDLSNNFGAGDTTYANVYNRDTPKSRSIPMSIEENEILSSIFDAIQVLDQLTATKFFDDLSIQNSLEFVGGLAAEAGIDINTEARAKIAVPVPYGLTIEEIAVRYLGDPNRWIEIATLNNLKSPYIDEEGYTLYFLSNGSGRQFTVNDPEKRLYIGQKIILQSDTVPQFTRKIINLEELTNDNYLVTVDGDANLDNLLLSENARIKGFLAGTVNSQNQIWIPIDAEPAVDEDGVKPIFSVLDDEIARIAKVDWLLDDNGDIVIDNNGDFKLATGLTNLIQALKIKIKVSKGTLLQHLDFGLGIRPGVSIADIETGTLIQSLNDMIKDDPRFESVERLVIKISGSVATIDLGVALAGGNGILPISLNVPIN